MIRSKFVSQIRRGFSLVEVMIALGVVAMGALASLSLLSFANLHNYLEMERIRAHEIVSGTLEQQRSQFFPKSLGSGQTTIWDNGTADTTDDTEGNLFVTRTNAVTGESIGKTIAQLKTDLISTTSTQDTTPNPSSTLVQVDVVMEWTPRGRVGGSGVDTKIYREEAVAYFTGAPPASAPAP